MDTNDNATDTIDQENLILEGQEETQDAHEGSCEMIDLENDEVDSAYEDKLSETIAAQVRKVLPQHVVHAGEAQADYLEVLTESVECINGMEVDKVGLALVEPTLAPKAQTMTGVLATEFVEGDQKLELSWRYIEDGEEPGFLYQITLNGRWVKGFRDSAIADLVFKTLVDRQPSRYDYLIRQVCRIHAALAESHAQVGVETCDESYIEEFSRCFSRLA